MKKIVLLCAVAVLAGGMAWAQVPPALTPPGTPGGAGTTPPWSTPNWGAALPLPNAGTGLQGRTNLGALGALSIEGNHSAGRFSSDADDFIDVRFHNPQLHNFFFLGTNFGSAGPGGVEPSRTVHFGLSRVVGDMYLAFYYGGTFVDAVGQRNRENPQTPDPADRFDARARTANWNNRFAVLLGVADMGFRLDVGMSMNTWQVREEGSNYEDRERWRTNAPFLALTWGANMGDVLPWGEELLPWARVAYRLPNRSRVGVSAPNYDFDSRWTGNAAIEVSGGARLVLSPATALGTDLWFSNVFQGRVRVSETSESDVANQLGGGRMGFGLGVYYVHNIDFGDVFELRFRPLMNFGYTRVNRDQNINNNTIEIIGDRWTSLHTGVEVGASLQISERISLFSGTTMRVFDWTTRAETGRDRNRPGIFDADDNYIPAPNLDSHRSSWRVSGILTSGITFGMVFTPIENVEIGIGLNPFVNGLFGNTTGSPAFDIVLSARL
ncbi:MAG: hypothetical protein FWC64_09725 [Treponema sp.]|nr:hypothetical protein [Treponema sp.]